MRSTLKRTAVPPALVATLALTACAGQERATFEEADPAAQAEPAASVDDAAEPDTAERTTDVAEPDTTEVAEETEGGPPETAAGTLTPVAWPDAPRELSEVEQEFMYEAGPFAGDAYDEERVLEAVLAMDPSTAEEWQQAIRSQIQGDYAADLQAAITFDPGLGDGAGEPADGAGEPAGEPDSVGTNHFVLVLDASGSMAEESGSGTRMAEAKEALTGFADTLPEGSSVSLRVYGHEGDNSDAGREISCASTESVYSGAPYEGGFTAALDDVEPVGWTPLGLAISEAADDIPADATDGIVYVVTDGIETCGGDPVVAAQDLAGAGIEPIVNVIGFQAGDADQEALRAIADAGGGKYTQADTQADLEQYWQDEYTRMMGAWSDWKNAELTRISEEGQANMATADEVGRRLMDGADDEGRRGMDLADLLQDDEKVDYDTGRAVWRYFYERKTAMWSHAYDVKNANWSAAYDIKNDAWSEVYDRGSSKWSEYYSKKNDS